MMVCDDYMLNSTLLASYGAIKLVVNLKMKVEIGIPNLYKMMHLSSYNMASEFEGVCPSKMFKLFSKTWCRMI